MTKLLEDAIEKARRLPPDRQDVAAECLLSIVAESEEGAHSLNNDQAEEVCRRLGDQRHATDEEVAAFFNKMSA